MIFRTIFPYRCILLMMPLLVGFGCSPTSQKTPSVDLAATHYYFNKTEQHPVVPWGYEGETGPEHWGELHPSYSAASNGRQQSPVNIDTAAAVTGDLAELKFDYQMEQIAAMNNGHTIQHNQQAGSFLWIGDEQFLLEQFHIHTPSEHTIDGHRFPMEIHFVHKSPNNQVAVVAVLVEADVNGTVDVPSYYGLPTKEGVETRFSGQHNASVYLPATHDYYEYQGSFTTPPCMEGVRWIVMKQPIKAKPEVISRFETILKANSRPVQPLYERQVARSDQKI